MHQHRFAGGIPRPEATVDASSAQLPNVITPNQDGMNERLTLYLADDPDFPLLSIVERYDTVVFNRWGGEVYRTTGAPVNGTDASKTNRSPKAPLLPIELPHRLRRGAAGRAIRRLRSVALKHPRLSCIPFNAALYSASDKMGICFSTHVAYFETPILASATRKSIPPLMYRLCAAPFGCLLLGA